MIVKVHNTFNGRKVVAICDEDIFGKKFEDGNVQLDLTSNFYNGDKISDESALQIIRNANVINVVGKESVSFVKNAGISEANNILFVDKIPHVQIVLN